MKPCSRRWVVGWLFALLMSLPTLTLAQETTPAVDPTVQAVEAAGLSIHVVQRNENLFRIALRYGLTTQELADINGIFDVNSIKVGQRLLVPSADDATPPPRTHTVQPGETLSSIAQAYDIRLETLLERNNLTDADTLYAGQELSIVADELPAATPTPLPASTPQNPPPPSTAVAEASSDPDDTIADDIPLVSDNLHIVQPGETLFRIATGYGLTTAELADANNISDPTRITAGQQLIVPGLEPVINNADLPAPITALDVQPLIFKEGETGGITLTTATSATVSATFLDRDLTVIPQQDNTRHQMLVPVPLFSENGVFPVTITASPPDGSVTEFTFNIRVAGGGYPTQNLNISAEMANLLAPAVQENELNMIESVTRIFTEEKYYDGAFSIPAAAAMNAPYGTRRSYNGGDVSSFHSGADFASAPGTPIYAAERGKVVLADALNIRGNTVVIDHGWSVYTVYAHLQSIDTTLGQTVDTGQVIGTAGSTGRVTGPHLHWEVWVNGVPVNPLQWLQRSFP